MKNSTKYGIIAAIVLIVAAMLFSIKYLYDQLQKERALRNQKEIEFKQLEAGVRSKSEYVTKKDINDLAKSKEIDLAPIKKDIKELGAKMEGISHTTSRSGGYVAVDLPSSKTTERPDKPSNEEMKLKCDDGKELKCPGEKYLRNRQVLALEEPFLRQNVPVGEVGFSAWKANPWDKYIYPREYSSITVISRDENDRINVHNKLHITANGEKYSIPIEKAEFMQIYPKNRFRFSPRLYLGVGAGLRFPPAGEVTPNLQLTLFSYGKTKLNPDMTFLGLGVGYETQSQLVSFVLSPINYNLGKHLPLVNNLYIGPVISLNKDMNIGALLGISVGL